MKIVVLTGAGISKESDIATFRESVNGLWEKYDVEKVATIEGYKNNPELCFKFYQELKKDFEKKEPNLAHRTLAELERKYKEDFWIITQNIDDLHEKAGNKNIIHIHGSLNEYKCNHCKKTFVHKSKTKVKKCQCCQQNFDSNSFLDYRPNVVLFGEVPLHLDKAYSLLEDCDLFISIGTSGNVYPANEFVEIAKRNRQRAKTVELNLEISENMTAFDEVYLGNATKIVPEYCHIKNLL